MLSNFFKPLRKENWSGMDVLFFAASVFVFMYVVLRSVYVPVVHDETITFFRFVKSGQFLPFTGIPDANNHVVNSAFSWVFYSIAGKKLLVLRLANVLALVLYLVYSYKITRLIQNKWLQIIFALSLIGVDFVIEFFGMSRGYGLSMAFFIISLYYCMRLNENVNARNVLGFVIGANASVGSNLSLIVPVFFAFSLVIFFTSVAFFRHQKKVSFNYVWLLEIAGFIGILFWIYYAFYLKKAGALYYGTKDGFTSVTVNSLLDHMFNTHAFYIQMVVYAFFTLVVLVSVFYFFKFGIVSANLPGLLLAGTVIGIVAQSKLLDLNFPSDRTALYFIPLFMLAVGFSLDILVKRQTYFLFLATPFLALPILFSLGLNLTYFKIWPDDAAVTQYYKYIVDHEKNNREMVTVGGLCNMVWFYNNFESQQPLQPLHSAAYVNNTNTYNLIHKSEFKDFKSNYDLVDSVSYTGVCLIKQRVPCPITLLKKINVPDITNSTDMFIDLFKDKKSAYLDNALRIEISGEFTTRKRIDKMSLIIAVTNDKEELLHYECLVFDWIKDVWDNTTFHFFRNLVKEGAENTICIYFLNGNEETLSLKDVQITINKLY